MCVECLYKEIPENYQKALDRATWFLDVGDIPQGKQLPVRVLDWEQDGHIIFPALNKVAGAETRTVDYMHWWTFLGLFNEVGDGLFTQVISIRTKKAKHKKLDKTATEIRQITVIPILKPVVNSSVTELYVEVGN